uniref:Uncharacterized protein n=1 Tax=Pseudomonas tritici TaxID=2745518 RepID=A0A8H9YWK7_9PSED
MILAPVIIDGHSTVIEIQLNFGAVSHTRPEEASLIQTPGGKVCCPDGYFAVPKPGD